MPTALSLLPAVITLFVPIPILATKGRRHAAKARLARRTSSAGDHHAAPLGPMRPVTTGLAVGGCCCRGVGVEPMR